MSENKIIKLINSGLSFISQRKYKEAIEYFNLALKENCNSIEALYNKANCLRELKRRDEAITCYEEIIKTDPSHIQAHIKRGICFMDKKKYQEAINCFNDVLKIDVNNYNAYYNIGICFHKLKDYNQSVNNYNISISLKQDFADCYLNKGNVLDEMGNSDKAIESYDLALKYDGKMTEAIFNKGLVLSKKLDFKSAINCYDKTILLDPENYDAYYRKGICLEEIKEYEKAISSLTKAIDLSPENPTYISERAIAYLEINEKLNGFNDLNHARKILEEESKLKYIEEEMVIKSKKNVEKLDDISVIDVLELITDKIDFLEGNKEIRREFQTKYKPEIKKNIESQMDSGFKLAAGGKNNFQSENDDSNKKGHMKINDNNSTPIIEKTFNPSIKEMNNITQNPINKENISNIKYLVNHTSKTIKNNDIASDVLKNIYDLLFILNEKIKEHEKKISRLSKAIDEIEEKLETKLTDHRKALEKDLNILLEYNLLKAENKLKLIEFYNGFNSCFNRFYLTSQMIIQEQFKLTDNKIISICSHIVSIIPVLGKIFQAIGPNVANYLRNIQLKNQSRKFLGLAADCTELGQIIGKCSLDLCKSKEMQFYLSNLKAADIEKIVSSNYMFAEKYANKIEEKLTFSLFNPKLRNAFNKLGEYYANKIIIHFLDDKFDLDKEYEIQFVEFTLKEIKINQIKVKEIVKMGCSSVCKIF